jgi:hypothetical protein
VNFDNAVENSSSIPKEHKASFVECLRKIPDFSWVLGMPNPRFDRLQGDFLRDFPIIFLKPDGTVLVARKPVMVVNNTCDIPPNRSEMVTVAPVLDFGRYLQSLEHEKQQSQESIQGHARDIRQNQISHLLYVPNLTGFPDGAIVRLDRMCSVAYVMLEQAIQAGSRLASFTQNGFYILLLKLTYHLVRPESAEVTRPAP